MRCWAKGQFRQGQGAFQNRVRVSQCNLMKVLKLTWLLVVFTDDYKPSIAALSRPSAHLAQHEAFILSRNDARISVTAQEGLQLFQVAEHGF